MHDDPDLEDYVQETMVPALKSPPDANRPPRPWPAEVLRNAIRSRWRRHARATRREGEACAPEGEPSPEEVLAREFADFFVARGNVPAERRDAIRKRALEEIVADGSGPLEPRQEKCAAMAKRFDEMPPLHEHADPTRDGEEERRTWHASLAEDHAYLGALIQTSENVPVWTSNSTRQKFAPPPFTMTHSFRQHGKWRSGRKNLATIRRVPSAITPAYCLLYDSRCATMVESSDERRAAPSLPDLATGFAASIALRR